jgi:hypothetical protein
MIQTSDFQKWVGILWAELFGVTSADSGYFLDDGQSGLCGSLAAVNAQTASTSPRPGGETIASHSAHVLYFLNWFLAHTRGENPPADWPGSWRTQTVTEAEWDTLRRELRTAYEQIAQVIHQMAHWSEPALAAVLILLPHCAYHLGEIRQMITVLKG